MPDPAPIYEENEVQVFPHGNKAFPEGRSFIIQDQQKRGTVEFLEHASMEEFKAIFQAAANPDICGEANDNHLMVLHAMDPKGDTDNTNSSRDYWHLHAFPQGVADTHAHVTNATKSYVPSPNEKLETLAATLKKHSDDESGLMTTKSLSKSDGAEAKYHAIIANGQSKTFREFCDNATDEQWGSLQVQMQRAAKAVQNGVRFVFRDNLADYFTIEALGGENLARLGHVNSKGSHGRWFDKPALMPAP